MKKIILLLLVVVMGMGVLAGCGKDKAGQKGTIATNGSTSMEYVMGILSEKYMADNPGIAITYDATGSGTGIEAVRKGSCDIGLASRYLKESEKQKGLVETTVAIDGIAIIVNENSALTDISVENIAGLFDGTISDWSQIGGGKGTVAAIGREAGSGTRDGFEGIVNRKGKCKLSQELTSTGAVIEAVKNSDNAIGYASYASVEHQKGIKILKVNGVVCNEENISSGKYLIQRPFNLITKADGNMSPAAKAFFEYAISKQAAQLISQAGAVPVAR